MHKALLVTPILPQKTGLATYALRVLRGTTDLCEWTVVYPYGGDPDTLPKGVSSIPLEELMNLPASEIPEKRIFQLGNSVDCFPIVHALYKLGGTAVFHETVLHHMLRYCYLEAGMLDEYRRELRFSYGPGAAAVEKTLSVNSGDEYEYDLKLKKYPLIGRAVHASNLLVCLNEYAAERIRTPGTTGEVITIGHPLTPVGDISIPDKPFDICIGMVGSYTPGRNYEAFMKAIAEIRKKRPSAGAVLIGDGYPDDSPEWAVKTGRIPEDSYQGWIRILDAAVDARYPTCGETSGSLLEVLRAGVPSVVINSGSYRNIPSDAVMHISPEGISTGIEAALERIFFESKLQESLSSHARIYAAETGSAERLRSDWETVLERSEIGTALPDRERHISISPSLSDSPDGFTRILSGDAVSWQFHGKAETSGPESSEGAWVTACGDGEVNGLPLSEDPAVMEIRGNVLEFTGTGRVTDVLWK